MFFVLFMDSYVIQLKNNSKLINKNNKLDLLNYMH